MLRLRERYLSGKEGPRFNCAWKGASGMQGKLTGADVVSRHSHPLDRTLDRARYLETFDGQGAEVAVDC